MFEFLTKSKQDVICSLLCLVEQRPNQLSLRGDVERQRTPQLHPRQPRDHWQGQIWSLKLAMIYHSICIYTRLSLTASFTSRKYWSNDMFKYLTATGWSMQQGAFFIVPAYFIFCAYENVTLSAGRVATRRSGTESPSRSGSKTACDSMSFSRAGHKVFPGE